MLRLRYLKRFWVIIGLGFFGFQSIGLLSGTHIKIWKYLFKILLKTFKYVQFLHIFLQFTVSMSFDFWMLVLSWSKNFFLQSMPYSLIYTILPKAHITMQVKKGLYNIYYKVSYRLDHSCTEKFVHWEMSREIQEKGK